MNPHEELDLDFYIFMNNDLANHLLYDYEKIKNHFYSKGIQEKRLFSKFHSILFHNHNWTKYISQNKDLLSAKINDEKTAFAHYVEHGIKEKREIYPVEVKNEDISKDMKFIELELMKKTPAMDFIKDIYPDMKNKSKNDIIQFVNKNSNKKDFIYTLYHEDLHNNYDWDKYLTNNGDLRSNKITTKMDAFRHYVSFGEKEGRVLKKIVSMEEKINNGEISEEIVDDMNEEIKVELEEIYEDTSNQIIHQMEDLSKEELFALVQKNVVVDIDVIQDPSIQKYKGYHVHLSHLYKLDPADYQSMNKLDTDNLIQHFLLNGMKNYLPYNKEHKLTLLNSCWVSYKKENKLDSSLSDKEAFHHYMKYGVYQQKNICYPKIKYKQELFVNSLYNLIHATLEDNLLNNFHAFLKNEDENKIFPDVFYQFIYELIDWNLFNTNNQLHKSPTDCFLLFIQHLNNFHHFNVHFNADCKMKPEVYDHPLCKPFYDQVIDYIHTKKSILEKTKYISILFHHDIVKLPTKYVIKSFEKSIKNQNKFNIIINYFNQFTNLQTLLLSIIYQTNENYQIIILNKNDDKQLKSKIQTFQKKFHIENIILIDFIFIEQYTEHLHLFDINIVTDTNIYFSNNCILNQIENAKHVMVENRLMKEKKINSLMIVDSLTLFNQPSLIHSYSYIEKDVYQIQNMTCQNDFCDPDFYNYDLHIDTEFQRYYPIYIFYTAEEQLNNIQIPYYYQKIKLTQSESLNDYLKEWILKNTFESSIFINLNEEPTIQWDLPNNIDEYDIYSLHSDQHVLKTESIPFDFKNLCTLCSTKIVQNYLDQLKK